MNVVQSKPLLRVPPFPGASAKLLTRRASNPSSASAAKLDALIAEVASLRVGGEYWAKQPELPSRPYVLVRTSNSSVDLSTLSVLRWDGDEADPWHLFSGASHAIIDVDDELAMLAGISKVPTTLVQPDGNLTELDNDFIRREFQARVIDSLEYVDPFNGDLISIEEAVRYCAFWRHLIDSNRDISAAIGFAFWKRPTAAPLLWNGDGEVPFSMEVPDARGAIAVWKARASEKVLEEIVARDLPVIEVEDGFIRSVGLGSDCVPPLSLVVDRLGVHFDPSRPSELEEMLEVGTFPPDLLKRAAELRSSIVASGLSKYEAGSFSLDRRDPNKKHILVPGQVEDDRAVVSSALTSNLELLRRVRDAEPNAYIIYKPHPDVEAGHRVGAIPDRDSLKLADEIVRDQSISALIDLSDEVHVNSSLAGFEALLRRKSVTTHGSPFYAGWGLTTDLGTVPARRTRTRNLDELVAAVLLIYPRYLDPVTGLPCPPEVLVRRISEGNSTNRQGVVVHFRRLQGRLKKGLSSLRAAR